MRLPILLLALSLVSCTPQRIVDVRPVNPEILRHIDHHIPGHKTVEGTINDYDNNLNRAVIGDLWIDLSNIQGIDFNNVVGRNVMIHGFMITEITEAGTEHSALIAYSLTTVD